MIQSLGDILMITSIISIGVVAFLLSIFLYHLIFVVMDLRQVMKRVNDLTEQIEEMLIRPVELVSGIFDWALSFLSDSPLSGLSSREDKKKKRKEKKEKRKRKKKGFESSRV